MQIIIDVDLAAEQYVEQGYHRRTRRPVKCGNCGRHGMLNVQGYYERDTSGAAGEAVRFKVKRFLCKVCGLTTSCLPSFAQPYRFLGSKTIEAFVKGETNRLDVQRAMGLLKNYRKRFEIWCKTLRELTGNLFGRAPPKETATAFLQRAVAACGSLAELTVRLVQLLHTTCFGTYRCHEPSHTH